MSQVRELLVQYLELRPVPKVSFETTSEGLVVLHVEKYSRTWVKRVLGALGWPLKVKIDLDELGSWVWKKMDGQLTVREIGEELGERGEEEALWRVALFVRYLYLRGWVEFV